MTRSCRTEKLSHAWKTEHGIALSFVFLTHCLPRHRCSPTTWSLYEFLQQIFIHMYMYIYTNRQTHAFLLPCIFGRYYKYAMFVYVEVVRSTWSLLFGVDECFKLQISHLCRQSFTATLSGRCIGISLKSGSTAFWRYVNVAGYWLLVEVPSLSYCLFPYAINFARDWCAPTSCKLNNEKCTRYTDTVVSSEWTEFQLVLNVFGYCKLTTDTSLGNSLFQLRSLISQ